MGKHGKRKIGGYEHVHTYNPKARESNERKMSNMQGIAIRRYQGYVDKIRALMFNYEPPEQRLKQKPGMSVVVFSFYIHHSLSHFSVHRPNI